MKVGTKSLLFGAHCFFIHPWFVAWSWWKLYGFPWDPRLWIAFFVHDLGYWGKPNMDGEEGEQHPYLGAKIMQFLFDKRFRVFNIWSDGTKGYVMRKKMEWYHFTLYHSRFLAKKNNAQYSKLCVADKGALCITPAWLYLPMVKATGEIKEYMKYVERNCNGEVEKQDSELVWYRGVQAYVRKWVDEHKEIKEDKWTPRSREKTNDNGIWK